MKVCRVCNLEKSLSEFPVRKQKGRKDYYRTECKSCVSEYQKSYQQENSGTIKERRREYSKRTSKKNVARASKWKKNNPDKVNFYTAARRAAKLNATPNWLTQEHHDQIKLIYAHAKECELLTGDKYHVDHIVPLQGENVSGLHVPWNLQVLPADINIKKSNSYGEETF